jgi:ketosteroid isomerase-like protein
MHSPADVVLAAIDAVEQRDGEKLLALCHDAVELHDAPSLPYGGSTRGKPALLDQLATAPETSWLGTWDPLQPTEAERRMDPRVVGTRGHEVTVLYTQRAVSAGGERFEAPVVALYEVRDGKVARAQMFHYDTAAIVAFLERAGAASRPSAA